MTKVKICGITNIDDALAAVSFGTDALGFIFAKSPRKITQDTAKSIIQKLPPFVLKVGVFVNATIDQLIEIQKFCGLDALQLHGDETEEMIAKLLLESPFAAHPLRIIKGLQIGKKEPPKENAYPNATLLLDTYSPNARGGTGHSFDWRLAIDLAKARPVILAGGLNAENVSEAIKIVNPYAVDIASGVELEPGRKDHEKLQRFIRSVKIGAC